MTIVLRLYDKCRSVEKAEESMREKSDPKQKNRLNWESDPKQLAHTTTHQPSEVFEWMFNQQRDNERERVRATEKCGQFNYLSDIWVCDSLCVAHRQFGTIKSSSFFNIVWYASRFDRNLIFLMCKYIPNWNRSQNVCLPFALSLCFSHSPFGLLFLLHIQLTKTDR